MAMFGRRRPTPPIPPATLPDRAAGRPVPDAHHVTGRRIQPPFPAGLEVAVFGMGCFWGAERLFWETEGVWTTAVGYAGGHTVNPTYEDVCSGRTGHAEVVLVAFDPDVVTYDELLRVFWEGHDPTQGMRQGNDAGTQYRSFIGVFTDAQAEEADSSLVIYERALTSAGYSHITTEIFRNPAFHYAEADHQQYLSQNPYGYCGLDGTGVTCPAGLAATD